MSMRTIDCRYFSYFADCKLVKGANKSAIYDFARRKIVLFPTQHFAFANSIVGASREEIINMCNGDAGSQKRELFDFILANEYGFLSVNTDQFPSISDDTPETPSHIDNAIIDVKDIEHDFESLFMQLDGLGCQFVQVRFFASAPIGLYERLVTYCRESGIRSLELIVPHPDEDITSAYMELVNRNPMLLMVVYASPKNLAIKDVVSRVQFIEDKMDDSASCGNITLKSLCNPSAAIFRELSKCNGCLNKKVSIDSSGNIKNCPSTRKRFGNVRDTFIQDVITRPDFRKLWDVAKDEIEVCKDCQFRYVCTDCRAYVQDDNDIYSKPSKCCYDPYRDVWVQDPKDLPALAKEYA
jgi:SPASM domain peptide maturase of grasp-with-spasm system